MSFLFALLHKTATISAIHNSNEDHYTNVYIIFALLFCFYPLAGCLADIKFGRYKTIVRSMYVLVVILVLSVPIGLLWVLLLYSNTNVDSAVYYVLLCFTIILAFIIASIIVVFNANVIQFGMDQLHDSPVDHQSLFIHWYVWTWTLGYLVSHIILYAYYALPTEWRIKIEIIYIITSVFGIFILIASLCLAYHKKNWFLIDSARLNPYKLVYGVTKFSQAHKIPVQRSAFTYCEDEIPSGLDLGKAKYGGPFTTEQVEDVKAFYGILKVLFAMGPVFFIGIATDRLQINYYFHTQHFSQKSLYLLELFPLGYGILSTLLIVVFIPLYIFFVRPFISHYIPGMLKRIGLGILMMVVSLICTFIMDTAAHLEQTNNTSCLIPLHFNESTGAMSQNSLVLVVPQCLSAIYTLLIYIALYEFICSQSPHPMKGLLIGLSFTIKGLFELFGIIVVILFAKYTKSQSFPSCGMEYYIMNTCAGLFALILYFYAAKKYKNRLRDEPCYVRRYVEEYYSKLYDERLRSYEQDMYH